MGCTIQGEFESNGLMKGSALRLAGRTLGSRWASCTHQRGFLSLRPASSPIFNSCAMQMLVCVHMCVCVCVAPHSVRCIQEAAELRGSTPYTGCKGPFSWHGMKSVWRLMGHRMSCECHIRPGCMYMSSAALLQARSLAC